MSTRSSLRLRQKASLPAALPPFSPATPAPTGDERAEAKRRSNRKTLSLDELPAWQHDNEFIITGYRGELHDWRRVLWSAVGYLHNETVNIWTHAVGALVAFGCIISIYIFNTPNPSSRRNIDPWLPFLLVNPRPHPMQLPSITQTDAFFHAIFLCSALFCLSGSAMFHCVNCHSQKVSKAFNRIDYIGIVVLIVGSFCPSIYYGFFCHEALQRLYLCGITLAGAAAMYTVIAPLWNTPAYRRRRTYVFIALGLTAIFPIVHALLLYGWKSSREVFRTEYLVLEGLLYIGGALLYAERVPERFFPGRFDIFGASHQIFHVMINLAATSHYAAIAEAFRQRHYVLGAACKI